MTRRRVSQAELAELRKRAPRGPDPSSVSVIVRTIVTPGIPTPPYTPMQEAMIAAATADFRKDGRIRQLIFDHVDSAGDDGCADG